MVNKIVSEGVIIKWYQIMIISLGAGSTERLDRLPTPVPVANPRIRPSRYCLSINC